MEWRPGTGTRGTPTRVRARGLPRGDGRRDQGNTDAVPRLLFGVEISEVQTRRHRRRGTEAGAQKPHGSGKYGESSQLFASERALGPCMGIRGPRALMLGCAIHCGVRRHARRCGIRKERHSPQDDPCGTLVRPRVPGAPQQQPVCTFSSSCRARARQNSRCVMGG